MAIHSWHPDTHEFGLADDCERCAEHAQRPLSGLDDRNLRNLYLRVINDEPARSENERQAMWVIEDIVVAHRRLEKLLSYDG